MCPAPCAHAFCQPLCTRLLRGQAGGAEHKRTTALLSATLHERLTGLAAATLREPATVGFTLAKVRERGA